MLFFSLPVIDWNTVIDSNRINITLFSKLLKVKLRASIFFYFLFSAIVVNERLVIGVKKARLTDTKTTTTKNRNKKNDNNNKWPCLQYQSF